MRAVLGHFLFFASFVDESFFSQHGQGRVRNIFPVFSVGSRINGGGSSSLQL